MFSYTFTPSITKQSARFPLVVWHYLCCKCSKLRYKTWKKTFFKGFPSAFLSMGHHQPGSGPGGMSLPGMGHPPQQGGLQSHSNNPTSKQNLVQPSFQCNKSILVLKYCEKGTKVVFSRVHYSDPKNRVYCLIYYQNPPNSYIAGPRQVSEATSPRSRSNLREKSPRKAVL